jgi:hypothetical protein
MAISSSVNKRVVTADGTTTEFDFNFVVNDPSNVKIYLNTLRNEVLSGFEVQLNPDQQDVPGGQVVFGLAPEGELIILRVVPETQETVFNRFGPFPAKTVEFTFDQLVLMIQQLREEANRSIKVDVTEFPEFDYLFPAYVAGNVLRWSLDDPQILENLDISAILDFSVQEAVSLASDEADRSKDEADRSKDEADNSAFFANELSQFLNEFGAVLEFPADMGFITDGVLSQSYDLGGLI